MKRHLTTVAAATAALGVLAACSSTSTTQAGHPTMSASGMSASGMPMTTGSGSGASPSASATPAVGAHNQADIAFATEMIPHHRQAVQMADLALSRATNAEVKTLAQAIKAAQDPEIVRCRAGSRAGSRRSRPPHRVGWVGWAEWITPVPG